VTDVSAMSELGLGLRLVELGLALQSVTHMVCRPNNIEIQRR